jgi:murein DD-endopeptidase MepM/ murein hydrolase activator NlpD
MNFKITRDRKYRTLIFRSFVFSCIVAGSLLCAKMINPAWRLSSNFHSNAPSPAQKSDSSPSHAGADAIDPAKCAVTPVFAVETLPYVIKPGDTFLGILSKHGMSNQEAIESHRSLAAIGLQSITPGDSLVLKRRTGGDIAGFSILHRLCEWYTVAVDSAHALAASKRPADFSLLRCLAKGELSTSLSESMNELGVDAACVSMFAEIFGWDINFFVDPKVGDTYEIIFEKKFLEGRFAGYGDILAAQYVNSGRVFRAFGLRDEKGVMRYFDPEGKSMQKQFLKAPLRFNHISSSFSHRRKHPILGIVRPHLGVDYAAPVGTPVHASADGIVRFVGYNGGFGNQVVISHGSAYETSYGHLRGFARGMRAGTRVCQGDLIGYVGGTGLSTGPHLDYRMTRSKSFVNPSSVNLPSGKGVAPEKALEFQSVRQECQALLNLRLAGRTGAWVLDVSGGSRADSAAPRLSMFDQGPKTAIP